MFLPTASRNAYLNDRTAFLFSFVNPYNYAPFIAPIKPVQVVYTFYDHVTSFPVFGWDYSADLKISSLTTFSMTPNFYDYNEGVLIYHS